jgi:hypothetical protein
MRRAVSGSNAMNETGLVNLIVTLSPLGWVEMSKRHSPLSAASEFFFGFKLLPTEVTLAGL